MGNRGVLPYCHILGGGCPPFVRCEFQWNNSDLANGSNGLNEITSAEGEKETTSLVIVAVSTGMMIFGCAESGS
jgi:hypothetical protein